MVSFPIRVHPSSIRITLLTFSMAVFGLLGSVFGPVPSFAATEHFRPALDRQSLHYIVRQTTDTTCGPASLATILVHYFGEPVSEYGLYEAALETMLGPDYQHFSLPITTFRGLLGALADVGYTGHALHMDTAGLALYFDLHEVPIVLQLDYVTSHFTVVLGVIGGLYVLADSSVGFTVMTADELKRHWTGYALLIEPPPDRTFNSTLRQRQLTEAARRHDVLNRFVAWL